MDITIKTQTQIETEMTQAVPVTTPLITYFGLNGIMKSLVKASAAMLRDMYHLLGKVARARFLDTSSGVDLVARVSEDGLTPLGANAASVILQVSGTVGIPIPEGTIVICTVNNIQFRTTSAITIGTQNPDLYGLAHSTGLSDIVLAECLTAGSIGNVPVGTVTQLQTPIPGVTAITNPAPGYGGQDIENDHELRERDRNRITLLNQGTQLFYETLAQEVDPRVLRAISSYYAPSNGVQLVLANRSGANFSGGDLTAIEAGVYALQRAFSYIHCVNLSFTGITLAFTATLSPGADFDTVYAAVADNISNFLDFRIWPFGQMVQYDDLVRIVRATAGIDNLDVAGSFLVNSGRVNILISNISLPRFTSLAFTNKVTSVTKTVALNQSFVTS